MLLQYFTLHHVAAELRKNAEGAYCTECFTQERNTLHCVFERFSNNIKQTTVFECNLDSRNGALFLKDNFHRARKNTLDCFPELLGRTLTDAQVMPHERVMTLFLPPYTLHCIPFAGWNAAAESSPANALCTDAEGRIIRAFRSPQGLIGKPFVGTLLTMRPARNLTFADFPSETSLKTALQQHSMMLGKYYADEVLMRLGLNGSEILDSEEMQAAIEDIMLVAEDVRRECLTTSAFYLLRPQASIQVPAPAQATAQTKPLLSMLHLTNSAVIQEFASVSAAIQATITLRAREGRLHGLQTATRERVQILLTKAERALEHIKRDTSGGERAMKRRTQAELLLSQPNVQQKGLESVQVRHWDASGAETMLEIRINPALSLRENAEDFFAKASRAADAVKRRTAREHAYTEEIKRLRALQERLASITTESECEAIMNDLQKNAPDTSQHKKTTRFREFPLDEAHTLYVGKTAADNDELTVRFAKPQDYWFHARGVPGSHAVLRTPGGKQKPPKLVVEQAAAIAAYFSKARNAKLAPVAYTQKKYVRKPKGAAVGAVVIEREEVIMVRPHVPEGLLGNVGDDDV